MFKILGITDERTECECCGKRNIKCTVALEPVDSDGNDTGPVVYYGRQCAAYVMLGSKAARNVTKIDRQIDEIVRRNEANRWNHIDAANSKIARIAFSTFVATGTDIGFEADCIKAAANYRYMKTGRDVTGSYFAEKPGVGAIVRVDGKDPADVAFYEAEGFLQCSAVVGPL